MNKFTINQSVIRLSLKLITLASALLVVSCHYTKTEKTHPINAGVQYQQLTNYGDANLATLSAKLTNTASQSVHIVQLGDSHTAADFFTGQLRNNFQRQFGDGGVGFVNPVAVPGQRYSHIIFSHDKKAWQILSSRKDKSDSFPLGGFIAEPTASVSNISMKLRAGDNQGYRAQALYSSTSDTKLTQGSNAVSLPATNGQWRFSSAQPVSFPLDVTATSGQGLKLGGWFITKEKPGVIVSPLGINGATLTMVDKWQAQWVEMLAQTKPDLVILSYGTNEAFNDTLNLASYKQQLEQKVALIRRSMPQAVILLMGPSDSIKNKNQSGCQQMQPQLLSSIIQIQRQVAQSQGTLFWDWRAFMGGECSIQNWAAEGNAQPDLVHLSQNGYKKSADAMYQQLMSGLGLVAGL